jgi:signal recognition particle GTPase
MAGKVSDEDMFRLEKRIKKAEAIIACMTEEERTVPDLLARQVRAYTKMHIFMYESSLLYRF